MAMGSCTQSHIDVEWCADVGFVRKGLDDELSRVPFDLSVLLLERAEVAIS